ncbi:MAG: hypothetical protein V9F01_07830 [Chitinophagaceae bacterium]
MRPVVRPGVEVIKHEYRTVLTKSGSYFRYESQREDKLMVEQQITIGGKYCVTVMCPEVPATTK